MSESEAETTWMTRIDMNIPNTMIRNATSRRAAMRSEACAGALNIPEFAVVASAMAPFSYASPDLLTVARRWRRAEISGQAGATSQQAVDDRDEQQLREEKDDFCKPVPGALNPPQQAGVHL